MVSSPSLGVRPVNNSVLWRAIVFLGFGEPLCFLETVLAGLQLSIFTSLARERGRSIERYSESLLSVSHAKRQARL